MPDLSTAEYIKEHSFPGAKVECLNFGKVRKKRDTTKGDNTRAEAQKHKADGLKPNDIAEVMEMNIKTIRRNWNQEVCV